MTSEINYYDSNYNYIAPVRHFKSNDPYYYEVDNIPIKQLEESKNFLKDQVDGILRDRANFKVAIDRSGFTELQPFVTGSDRKVRVKAGRYSARVNDAYSITPLQVITQVTGFSNTTEAGGAVADLNAYSTQTVAGPAVAAALQIFQDGVVGTSLNMNGLAERTFTYPIPDEDGIDIEGSTKFLSTTSIDEYISLRGGQTQVTAPQLPNFIGRLYRNRPAAYSSQERLQLIRNVFTVGSFPDASQQGELENAFIKRWRGAIRTSIVDVSGELSITVPDFDETDFYYIDTNGVEQSITSNQRIDLVFIYSKAIDQESTTISSKNPGEPNNRVLTKPALGIVKGAGIGVSRKTSGGSGDVELTDLEGRPIMLAHPGDESSPNTGFETSSAGVIRGSFPSPDDLMNLAPVLSENLETNSIALIGQSILPVAYIRVMNAGGTTDILDETDIIDIRPFFRTTELAYNERAGIAAATPQVSIANPVVTEAAVEKIRKEVFSTLHHRINNLDIPLPSPSRIVGMGTICGGMRYGPEGALFRQSTGSNINNKTWNQMADDAEATFNYLPGSITHDPAWDVAPWALTKSHPGLRGADHIHVCWPLLTQSRNGHQYYLPPFNRGVGMGGHDTMGKVMAASTEETAPGMCSFGIKQSTKDEVVGLPTVYGKHLRQNVVIHYCRKVIKINRDEVAGWMTDYTVNASLLNCIPLSARANSGSKRQGHAAGASNIWINKAVDYFVINVAWVADDFNDQHHPQDYSRWKGRGIPWAHRNDLEELAAFALPEIPIVGNAVGGNFQEYGSEARAMPGGQLANTGNKILSVVNSQAGEGTGLNNANTSVSYLTPVTPIVYPSVSYEIIGHGSSLTDRSPRGWSMVRSTPTIELA